MFITQLTEGLILLEEFSADGKKQKVSVGVAPALQENPDQKFPFYSVFELGRVVKSDLSNEGNIILEGEGSTENYLFWFSHASKKFLHLPLKGEILKKEGVLVQGEASYEVLELLTYYFVEEKSTENPCPGKDTNSYLQIMKLEADFSGVPLWTRVKRVEVKVNL